MYMYSQNNKTFTTMHTIEHIGKCSNRSNWSFLFITLKVENYMLNYPSPFTCYNLVAMYSI